MSDRQTRTITATFSNGHVKTLKSSTRPYTHAYWVSFDYVAQWGPNKDNTIHLDTYGFSTSAAGAERNARLEATAKRASNIVVEVVETTYNQPAESVSSTQ
jgi:hypothetical protein